MATLTRKVDKKARVALFSDFADATVIVERVSEDEIRIRRASLVPKRKYTLAAMLAAITPETIHGEIDTGPAVGNEAL